MIDHAVKYSNDGTPNRETEDPSEASASNSDKTTSNENKEPESVKRESKVNNTTNGNANSRRKSSVATKVIDLDDVLINELGQFGRFQLHSIFLVAFPLIMNACMSEYIFSAAAIPHRCQIPECGETGKDHYFHPDWISGAIPASGSGLSSCERYVPVANANGSLNQCPANLFTSATTVCEGYVYSRDNSVVYEFDLGCEEWLRALAGTLHSVGTLLVLPIIGFISDKYGRRVALVISVFNVGLFGLIRAFSVNYPMYLAFQLIQTTMGAGTFSAAYILATELVGPKYRVATGAMCNSIFAVGQVIVGSVAWLVQPWRYMIMTLHIPCFLIIIYYWILTESVRWLLSKNKTEKAREVLEKVARVNKKTISEQSMQALLNPPLPAESLSETETPGLINQIIKSPTLLRRVCTTPIWWITTTFVYYGLSINSVSLSETIYLNYILICAIEIPGFCTAALVLNRIGRKATLSIGFFSCAVCNIAFAFVPTDMTVLRLILFLTGKFFISIVFTSLYLFTSELYPTQFRHSLLAFSSMVGRIGSITAPMTPVLMVYWDGIPSLMFAVMAIISGACVLTQPETLGTNLPDTLEEAEALGKMKTKQVF